MAFLNSKINQDHQEFAVLLSMLDILQQVSFIMDYRLKTRAKLKIMEKILKFVKQHHRESEISKEFLQEYLVLLNMYKPKKVNFFILALSVTYFLGTI
jgi:hypothetical protein